MIPLKTGSPPRNKLYGNIEIKKQYVPLVCFEKRKKSHSTADSTVQFLDVFVSTNIIFNILIFYNDDLLLTAAFEPLSLFCSHGREAANANK